MKSVAQILALSLLVSSQLFAQQKPQTREGFTISFGLGGGSAGFDCNGCDSERETGSAGYLRMGGTVRPNLIIGGESNGFYKTKTEGGVDGTFQLSYLTGFAQWYPQPVTGFFVKGGLGFGLVSVEAIDQATSTSATLESSSVALSLGAGFDWRLGKNFSLSPYANFIGMAKGDAKINGSSIGEKLGANVFQIGLGFTWH
jgi:hypothetical protein